MTYENPVLIDTDGQADSLWGLIVAKQNLDVKAITACSGKNSNPEDSFANALAFAGMAGYSCPIAAGSKRAVLKRDKPAWPRFAPDGKCGLPLPPATIQYEEIYAWDRIYQEAVAAKGKLVLLCFGPMTNIALAIFKYPDLPKLIQKIAFVGGSYDYGDYSRVAEINMATDPQAAMAVFQSDIRLEMYGYNAELASALTNTEIAQIADGTKSAYTTAFVMCAMSHAPNTPIYYGPALAAMGLSNPKSVVFERLNVFLESKSTVCCGRTTPLNMYTPLGYDKTTRVAMSLDKACYITTLKDALATGKL